MASIQRGSISDFFVCSAPLLHSTCEFNCRDIASMPSMMPARRSYVPMHQWSRGKGGNTLLLLLAFCLLGLAISLRLGLTEQVIFNTELYGIASSPSTKGWTGSPAPKQ